MRKIALILPMFVLLACGGGEKKEEGKDKGGDKTEGTSKFEIMEISSYELIELIAADSDAFIESTQEKTLVINDLVLESGYLQNEKLGATGVGYNSADKKIIGAFKNPYKYEKIIVDGDSVEVVTSEYSIELQEVKAGSLTEVKERESMEADGVGSISFFTKVSVSGVRVKMMGNTIIISLGEVTKH